MNTVIRIICRAHNGERDHCCGRFLWRYDPDAFNGRGLIDTTDQRDKALKFTDPAAALACYRRVSLVRPWRPDGRPNRPLTAYTVEILREEEDDE